MYALSTLRLIYSLCLQFPLLTFSFFIGYIFYKIYDHYYYYCIYEYYLYNLNKDCSICIEDCKPNRNNPSCVLLKCKHTFHFECIKNWILSGQDNNIKCPVCRADLVNDENKYF